MRTFTDYYRDYCTFTD